MTATLHAAPASQTAAETLTDLAVAWLNETRQASEIEAEVQALAHPGREPHETWALFEDLVEAVRLRDGVNDGSVHWSAVCDALTGPERSADAFDIACVRADEAAHALINGRSR